MRRPIFNRLIADADLAGLFITEMGWNNPKGSTSLPAVEIDSVTYRPQAVAEKSGFKVLVCEVDRIPATSVCRRIDLKVRRFANDYIMIFMQRKGFHHLWLAPVQKVDKRDVVTTEYTTADQAEFLFQKVDNLSFDFDEEVTITDVRQRVQESFAVNSEKITKDFYAGFKKEHKAFVEFISGIEGTDSAVKDRQWYASVMLNRLMFCYFIQKKGFLDGDKDYLRNKLEWVRRERGEGHFFHSFYLGFLRRLFHDGLNTPRHDVEFEKTYGRIPYLNGGMFDEHKIERDYAGIDIDDKAFERLFKFFDRWNWHLDTRITASGKDINPDVLGYIFEQYINDRAQMGAYYTKEDITEYIGRNCILPYLFDQVKMATADSAKSFAPDGYVWRTLRGSGDRYIFDAVKKGYKDFDKIPDNIACGIITEEMRREYSETPVGDLPEGHTPLAELRAQWNGHTPEQWGLPNEIWRETIDRLQRCGEILGKINRGEITSINDFITYNLNIRSFAADLISNGDSRFVGWLYHALQRVTILDPTCGSGAFLFAAMNILEPLYEICIDRMQEFNSENPALFKVELSEITDKYRSNIQYFIFKSIILRNLYGVDIMVEATEIAKLRLFLKMVAVVDVDNRADNLGLDPLPDIDFNIRCGNTLVGYANKAQLDKDLNHAEDTLQLLANQEFKEQIEEEAHKMAAAYRIFVYKQLRQEEDIVSFKQAKRNLRELQESLNDKLNRRLHLATAPHMNYEEWLVSHQPFNWFTEFYEIIEGNHGFDVIIGNPPYVEISKNDISYQLPSHQNYKDLYAYVMERTLDISNCMNNIGFIIPISFNSTPGFQAIYNKYNKGSLYISSYADTAKMFQVTKRLSIVIKTYGNNETAITKYIKNNQKMAYRLANAPYINLTSNEFQFGGIPAKISSHIEGKIIKKYFHNSISLSNHIESTGKNIYYTRAIRNFRPFYSFIPCHKFPDGTNKIPTETKNITISEKSCNTVLATLNSNITFVIFSWFTDVRNINPGFINQLRIPKVTLDQDESRIVNYLEKDYKRNKIDRLNNSNGCIEAYYYPVKSKPIIDKIDTVLARHYGFTDEELDFIINYDIKYRMGDELNKSNE